MVQVLADVPSSTPSRSTFPFPANATPRRAHTRQRATLLDDVFSLGRRLRRDHHRCRHIRYLLCTQIDRAQPRPHILYFGATKRARRNVEPFPIPRYKMPRAMIKTGADSLRNTVGLGSTHLRIPLEAMDREGVNRSRRSHHEIHGTDHG